MYEINTGFPKTYKPMFEEIVTRLNMLFVMELFVLYNKKGDLSKVFSEDMLVKVVFTIIAVIIGHRVLRQFIKLKYTEKAKK